MLEPRPDSPTAQRSPTPNPAEGRADLFAAFFFREAHHVFVEFLEQHQISIAYLELLHFHRAATHATPRRAARTCHRGERTCPGANTEVAEANCQ